MRRRFQPCWWSRHRNCHLMWRRSMGGRPAAFTLCSTSRATAEPPVAGLDVIGAEAVRVERRPVLLQAAGEAGQRLPVGGDRAGRLPLHRAAGQVGGDEGGEEWIAGGQGVHRPSMDALLAREVKAAPPRTAGLLGAAGGWRQRRPGSKAAVRRACRHAAILARQRRRRARELWLGSVRSQGAGTNRARRSPAVPTMRPASPRSMTASARRRAVAAWPAGPAHPVVDGRGSPVGAQRTRNSTAQQTRSSRSRAAGESAA